MINVDAVIVHYIERLEEEQREQLVVTERKSAVKEELDRGLVVTEQKNRKKIERFFTRARAELAKHEADKYKLRKVPLSAEEMAAKKRKEEKEQKEAAFEEWRKYQIRNQEKESYLNLAL